MERGLLARVLACFGLLGFSLALFVRFLCLPDRAQFVEHNLLLFDSRGLNNGVALGLAVLFAAAGAVSVLLKRDRERLARLDAVARLLSPFLLLGLVPGLLCPWSDPLELAVPCAAFVLVLERLMRLHFGAYECLPKLGRARAWIRETSQRVFPETSFARRRSGLIFVIACAPGCAVYTSVHTVWNHQRFNTFDCDLGQLDNLFYNARHGHPMRCTPLIREGN